MTEEKDMTTPTELPPDEDIARAAEAYAIANIIPATIGAECVDGRYTPEEAEGRMRIAGGDGGALMAMTLALKQQGSTIDYDNLVSTYLTAKQEIEGPDAVLRIHSDDHHHEGTGAVALGCGHLSRAAKGENAADFGLTAEEMAKLYEAIGKKNPVITELKGSHAEKGAIFIEGETEDFVPQHTVKSLAADGESYFIVDSGRTRNYFGEVSQKMGEKGLQGLNKDNIWNAYQQQAATTLRLVKPIPTLPIITVRMNAAGVVPNRAAVTGKV